jgi:hypothetical protein
LARPASRDARRKTQRAKPCEREEKMIRTLKALGLLTIAALAISAMVASAAQAEVLLTSGKTPSTHTATNVHGVQHGTITENYLEIFGGSKISCENEFVKFYGKTTGSDKELTLEPTYGRGAPSLDCGIQFTNEKGEHELSKVVTFTMEGCDFKLKQPTHLEENTFTGNIDLVCPKEKDPLIHIFTTKAHTITLCTLTIEPPLANQNLSHIVYHNKTNVGAPDDITATVTIEGIQYITRGKGCPEADGTVRNDGKYFSNITLTSGETNGSKATVSLEDDLWLSTT